MGGTGSTTDPVDNSCAAHGGGWDHSAMVRALEKMANFEIGQNPSQA
jgi:2-hydroxy-3-oxopropionate reductase